MPDGVGEEGRIASCHFPKSHRPFIQKMPSKDIEKWRIPLDVGRALDPSDLCDDRKNYFACPMMSEVKTRADLTVPKDNVH